MYILSSIHPPSIHPLPYPPLHSPPPPPRMVVGEAISRTNREAGSSMHLIMTCNVFLSNSDTWLHSRPTGVDEYVLPSIYYRKKKTRGVN